MTNTKTILLLLIFGLGMMSSGFAQVWTAGTGDFNTPTNWNPNEVPASGDISTIDNGGTAIVSGESATTSSLIIGEANTGALTIENGGQLSVTNLYAGDTLGSVGTITVTGNSSTLNATSITLDEEALPPPSLRMGVPLMRTLISALLDLVAGPEPPAIFNLEALTGLRLEARCRVRSM